MTLAAFAYALGGVMGFFLAVLLLSGPSTTEDELALANHQLACQLADAREQLARRQA